MDIQIIARVIHLQSEEGGNVLCCLIINGISGTARDHEINAKCSAGTDEVDEAVGDIHVLIPEGCKVVDQDNDRRQRRLTRSAIVRKGTAVAVCKNTFAFVNNPMKNGIQFHEFACVICKYHSTRMRKIFKVSQVPSAEVQRIQIQFFRRVAISANHGVNHCL